MVKEDIFPITWKGWDTVDTLFNIYYGAEFTADFGVFREGEKFSSISINYSTGKIEAYNEDGTQIIKTQKYGCVPVTL